MSFYHGVELVEDNTGSRPITTVRSSVVGVVGTAPSADATVFPLDTPVLLAGQEATKISALGADGTLVDAMTGIFSATVAPMVVVIRVAEDADPATQIANVIGGIDAVTDERTGIQALLDAASKLKVKPKLLIAPTFTNEVGVANALTLVADKLKAIAIVETPSTTDAADLAFVANFDSARMYAVSPRVMITKAGVETAVANSSFIAGHIARIDNEFGWNYSPSNHVVNGINGTERAIDYDDTPNCRANYLNENKIAVIIHDQGYRLWGNYTLSSDTKWQFLPVRRTMDMVNESVAIAHKWAVDRGITQTLVEDIEMSINSYLRELVRQGKIIGGKCWISSDANPVANIVAGNLEVNFDVSPMYPAQHIKFISKLTNSYIEEIFK